MVLNFGEGTGQIFTSHHHPGPNRNGVRAGVGLQPISEKVLWLKRRCKIEEIFRKYREPKFWHPEAAFLDTGFKLFIKK